MTDASQPDKLDDLDRRIVAALQAAPRASWSQLGSVVAVSETTVMRRVQRLRDNGTLVILAAPDPLRCALGQPVHVYFETAPGEAPDLAHRLAERSDVRYVSLLAGTRDIMCELISPNHRELGRLLMGQLQKSEAVQRTTTAVVIKQFKTSDQWSGSSSAPAPQWMPMVATDAQGCCRAARRDRHPAARGIERRRSADVFGSVA